MAFNMTKQEFDQAVATIVQGGRKAIENECQERVYVAACQVVRHRLKLPDDRPIFPTDQEVTEVLTTADRHQRRLLKKIAEELVRDMGRRKRRHRVHKLK